MTESISELRKICQYPSCSQRAVSIYFTRILLKTPIAADQVTIFDFCIGLIGAGLLFIGSNISFLIGGILLQLFAIFDCVDGEIARYRQFQGFKKTEKERLYSEFVQDMVHPFLHPIIFLGLGFGLYRFFSQQSMLILGFVAAMGMSLDTYVNTSRERFLSNPEMAASRAYKKMLSNTAGIEKSIPLGKQILAFIIFIVPIPGVVTVLMAAPVLDYVFFPAEPYALMIGSFPLNFKIAALIFYAFIQQMLWLLNAKTSIAIIKNES